MAYGYEEGFCILIEKAIETYKEGVRKDSEACHKVSYKRNRKAKEIGHRHIGNGQETVAGFRPHSIESLIRRL